MQIAQRLYEGVNIGSETTGLITYMRTDGVQLGKEAIASVREEIGQRFATGISPDTPRAYRTAAANAQEAHEAIRPTESIPFAGFNPELLDYDQARLYDLIWKRTVASQMQSAELDRTSIDITNRSQSVTLRASGRVVVFDGYRSVYQEGRTRFPTSRRQTPRTIAPFCRLSKGVESLATRKVTPEQHFTQPPPRFTDASLVKAMEELGIGRPSTYASIIQVLQDRDYVIKDRGKFIPEDRGRLVVTFLNNFFSRYVEYDFTAKLEDQLDAVSDGKLDWKQLLSQFWQDFKAAIDSTSELRIANVIDVGRRPWPAFLQEGRRRRTDPQLLTVPVDDLDCDGKFGAFIGCSNYPECTNSASL